MRESSVRREDKQVVVSVPEKPSETPDGVPEARESIRIQGLLAQVGARMGLRIWIAAPDRAAVIREASNIEPALLTALPLNYDTTTLKTVENSDVLWLKGRSMSNVLGKWRRADRACGWRRW